MLLMLMETFFSLMNGAVQDMPEVPHNAGPARSSRLRGTAAPTTPDASSNSVPRCPVHDVRCARLHERRGLRGRRSTYGGRRTDEEEITRVSAGSTSAQTSHPHRRQPSHSHTKRVAENAPQDRLAFNILIFSRAFSATHLNDARSASADQQACFAVEYENDMCFFAWACRLRTARATPPHSLSPVDRDDASMRVFFDTIKSKRHHEELLVLVYRDTLYACCFTGLYWD